MDIKDAKRVAFEFDKKLKATDFSGYSWVLIQSIEGSQCLYRDAFVLKFGPYYLVFTEHYGYSVHHCDETNVFSFKDVEIKHFESFEEKDKCINCNEEFLVMKMIYDYHSKNPSNIMPLCTDCKHKIEHTSEAEWLEINYSI